MMLTNNGPKVVKMWCTFRGAHHRFDLREKKGPVAHCGQVKCAAKMVEKELAVCMCTVL